MKKGSIIKNISKEEADVILLRVPFEVTASGGQGAKNGPEAVIKMLNFQVEEWDYLLQKNTSSQVKIIQDKVAVSNLTPEEMLKAVYKKSLNYFSKGKFLAALGGEHSVSLGLVKAARKRFKNITVVQIDAHADLRNDNSDYEDNLKKITKYAHSCVMRRIYESACPIVQVGVRSLSPSEAEFIAKKNIKKNIFFVPLKENFKEIIAKIKTQKVYLTIDVDGFDPSVMPATGTPEPGGISWDWGIGFFQELFSKKEIIGLDIVEVASRHSDFITEFSTAKLLYHLIGLKFLR
jgi:agmatinase